MTYEEEQRLHSDKVLELLNEISAVKDYAFTDLKNFKIANTLGRCYEMLKTLHIINVEEGRENRAMSDHHRVHFSGMAMQALIISDGVMCDTIKEAFMIADSMVNYAKKQRSEAKCTDDGTGNTSTKDSN